MPALDPSSKGLDSQSVQSDQSTQTLGTSLKDSSHLKCKCSDPNPGTASAVGKALTAFSRLLTRQPCKTKPAQTNLVGQVSFLPGTSHLLTPPILLPAPGTANTVEEALIIAAEIGKYPIIIRPAFTLGGTGGGIAYNIDELKEIVTGGLDASMTSQVWTGNTSLLLPSWGLYSSKRELCCRLAMSSDAFRLGEQMSTYAASQCSATAESLALQILCVAWLLDSSDECRHSLFACTHRCSASM